jgi:hypothetical protein
MSVMRKIQFLSAVAIFAAGAAWPQQARGDEPYCQAGGPGASSCSVGGCSVQCSVGYACCNSGNPCSAHCVGGNGS